VKLFKVSLAALAAAAFISFSPAVKAAGVDELPKDIQEKLYNKEFMDPAQPLGPSAYRDFKAKKGPPWKIGYASSYAGNTWRAGVMDRLQNVIIPKWKQLGLISDVIVTQSNLDDKTQIQQMRQLVDQGVDAIIVCCSNPTALNQTVDYAKSKGIPVFSATGYLTSKNTMNSSSNYSVAGSMLGE
jgi:ribose transport system substrate-binding protein